jgi:hypothetical protein
MDFAGALAYCMETFELEQVPSMMEAFVSSPNRLEKFNFGSLHYYP